MRRRVVGLILGGVVVIGLVLLVLTRQRAVAPELTPTQGVYAYVLREPVAYTVDFTSQHGVCNNRYASGAVVDVDGQPVDGLQIVIRVGAPPLPEGQSIGAVTGADDVVGAGRWHTSLMRLGDSENTTIELRDTAGNLLAEPVPVSFDVNCAENTAVVNFAQKAD